MKEFRIEFSDPRGVNIEAETEEEAKQIVRDRDWEYGMDWSNGDIEIVDVREI
jgi:hypothetical protein